jgi:predicted TIM-barrel fold metal-dependent hydrolase
VLHEAFVIDSTVHGYHFAPENIVPGPLKEIVASEAAASVYLAHTVFQPPGDSTWLLEKERFDRAHDPDFLGHALFAESQTDFCVYHGVPIFGFFHDGGSPLWVGREMRDRWPHRVALYGPVSPWRPGAIDEVDRLVEEDGVVGIKLYPMDIVDGELRSYRLDDSELIFPIIERAQKLGIKVIATHKAIPAGRVPTFPFDPVDVEGAAAAFPDMTFEIVHAGYAFLEETALQLERFPNIVVNLEWVTAFLANASRRFVELLGEFCFHGGADRILWATGCTGMHPRPLLEAFSTLEMPEDLVEGYGFPELTREVKQGILGLNHARLLGLDVDEIKRRTNGDEFDGLDLADPWSSPSNAYV